jgi:SAM-dependent methyltransferase
MLRRLLAHPLTRGMDLDDSRTTEMRRHVVDGKPFLKKVYAEWCETIRRALPAVDGRVLEIGSGAGLLRQHIPQLITSDVQLIRGEVSLVLDAEALPFGDGTLKAISMVNVLHHVHRPRRFFSEAARCVKDGGALIMVEPWNTGWSRFVFGRFHHEPFDIHAANWESPGQGPLSGGNAALPWILFERDRERFEGEYPQWAVRSITRGMPFRYLLSGGVGLRSLQPGWMFPAWTALEGVLKAWVPSLALFALIVLDRRPREEGR